MSNRPRFNLDRPDALSSAITRLELVSEVYVNGDFCGSWAVDTSGSRRIPFHLIADGNAWLHVDGQPAKYLNEGDLIVFPSDKKHLMASHETIPDGVKINQPDLDSRENPTQMICGFFEFQNKSALPLLNSLAPVIVLSLGEDSQEFHARKLIQQIVYELKQEAPGHYVVINQLAYLLFIEIIRHQIRSQHVGEGMLAALYDSRLSKALAAIHNHPEKRWTLDALSSEANMGRSSFSALFTKLAGVSVMQYLTSWRMQHAKILLQSTEKPMWEIAELCGYESEASFQKAFKKNMGKTPGFIRRKFKR